MENNKDINEFIDMRIERINKKIEKNSKWKQDKKEYKQSYEELYNKLSDKDRLILENIVDSKNSMFYYQARLIYKVAFSDVMTILRFGI